MTATGWTPGEVGDLEPGQVQAMMRQIELDGKVRELQARVNSGEISAEAGEAALRMLMEG
jgi:hypothetical protein